MIEIDVTKQSTRQARDCSVMNLGDTMRSAVVFSMFLWVQGCTVVHYNSNELTTDSSSYSHASCELTYYIEVDGFGENYRQKELYDYSKAAKEALNNIGCKSKRLIEPQNADLLVRAQYNGHGGAAAQEFLTGLSFGLIPSWSTRKGMYTYTISSLESSKTYNLDHVSYNHLILFPFLWINLLTDSEKDHFGNALIDFIKIHNQAI